MKGNIMLRNFDDVQKNYALRIELVKEITAHQAHEEYNKFFVMQSESVPPPKKKLWQKLLGK